MGELFFDWWFDLGDVGAFVEIEEFQFILDDVIVICFGGFQFGGESANAYFFFVDGDLGYPFVCEFVEADAEVEGGAVFALCFIAAVFAV